MADPDPDPRSSKPASERRLPNFPVDRGKSRAAFRSMLAAIFLTAFKTVVGLATGSLGILAEALHSALDLVAALMTYLAVRFSNLPPDDEHQYGHGKIESLSALVETLLLVVTCAWIIHEGVDRLLSKAVHIRANLWAFLVIITSIVVDYNRSRDLSRAAKKYKSQALKADALHFSTDIWSSGVVLFGLALVKLGEWTGTRSLFLRADALAALGVAFIVLWVSLRLGRETLDVLLDTAPKGLADRVAKEALAVEGVAGCTRVRVRDVGLNLFVDMVVYVPGSLPVEKAHALVSEVERRIQALHPDADVTIHYEPAPRS